MSEVHSEPAAGGRVTPRRLVRPARWKAVVLSVCIAVSGAGAVGLAPTANAALADRLDFGGGATSDSFGPNSVVLIDGRLSYVDDCPDGVDDFVYPASDVYLVSGGAAAGAELSDAGGGRPNTIVSPGTMFIDELIAVTSPSGPLGEGVYDIVYDTCQNGVFEPELDTVFPAAVTVTLPAVLPPVAPALVELKAAAAEEAANWRETRQMMKLLFNVDKVVRCITGAQTITKLLRCMNKARSSPSGFGAGLKEDFLALLLNQYRHYQAIAEDPPDADFRRLADLTPIQSSDLQTDNAVETSLSEAVLPISGEAATTEALLHAVERYQGAQAAGDGEWALIQARQARNLAATLREHLPATTAAVGELRASVVASGADIDGAYQEARAFAGRVALNGLTSEERRGLLNQGLSSIQVAERETELRAALPPFDHTRLVALLDRVVASRTGTDAALSSTVTALDATIAELSAAGVPDLAPAAHAGGPYEVPEGQAVVLDASRSSAPAGSTITATVWDLDADGQFDDASGDRPQITFPSSGPRVLGVKVTSSSGREAVAYSLTRVAEAQRAPGITARSPHTPVVLTVGTPVTFEVTGVDADGDATTTSWSVDGVATGSGPAFVYDPAVTAVGEHRVTAAVSDGTPTGGTTLATWEVVVVRPDADGDDWTETTDCDEGRPAVHPGAQELLGNGIDDDCDSGTPDAPPGGLVGSLWSWGSNHHGQVGTGATDSVVTDPVPVRGFDDLTQVESQFGSNYALRADGRVLAWGANGVGGLGVGDLNPRRSPTPVVAVGGGTGELAGVTQLSAGGGTVLARRIDGTAVAWGLNVARQLGDGSTVNSRSYPVPVLADALGTPLTGVRAVENETQQSSYALMDDGSVRAWGPVRCNGGTQVAVQPFPVPLGSVGRDVEQIAAGNHLALFLKKDGTVLSCGPTEEYLLGRDTVSPFDGFVAAPVAGLGAGSGVIDISSSMSSASVLKADGTVWQWGRNLNYELDVLGVPHGGAVWTPQQVPLPPGPPVVDIEQDGACHMLARRADGSVLVWGCSTYGSAGVGIVNGPVGEIRVLDIPGSFAIDQSTSVWNSLALTRPLDDPSWERPATWVEVRVEDSTVQEAGDAGPVVRLSAALPHDVTVTWSARPDTTTQAEVTPGGLVSVPAGQTSVSLPMPVRDDSLDEDDESLTVMIDETSHGIRATRAQATVTVLDDDAQPSVSVDPVTWDEGDTSLTDALVAIRLSQSSGKPVTLRLSSSDGTATAPADYGAVDLRVTVPVGATTALAHLPVHGDDQVEPDEQLTVTLSEPENAVLGRSQAPVRLVDDDPLALTVVAPSTLEGDGTGTAAEFAVALNAAVPAGERVEVAYSLRPLTAEVPEDVTAPGGTLVFGPGTSRLTVQVDVVGDELPEPTEFFALALEQSTAASGRTVLRPEGALATIVDDDPANTPPTVDAGPALSGVVDAALPLVGTASDGDGDALQVSWSISRSDGSPAPDCALMEASSLEASVICTARGEYVAALEVDDGVNGAVRDSTTLTVRWPFAGFLVPVRNDPELNRVRSGSAIPIRWSLGGDRGLDVLAADSPSSGRIGCGGETAVDVLPAVQPGAVSLSYDPATGTYNYVWQTQATWAGTCRQFELQLRDGTVRRALFQFS